MVIKSSLRHKLRDFAGSMNRFLSVFAITALGAGFLAGIISTTPDMKDTLRDYYEEMKVYDLDIKGSAGFTADDVAEAEKLSGVLSAGGYYSADRVVTDGSGNESVARIYGAEFSERVSGGGGDSIALVKLISGRLPEGSGECLLCECNPYVSSYGIGDSFTVPEDEGILRGGELTVVGIMENPISISVKGEPSGVGSGTVSLYLMIGEDEFICDAYTDIYLLADGAAQLDIFGDEYKEKIEGLSAELETLGKQRSEIRYSELYALSSEKLDAARTEYRESYERAKSEIEARFAPSYEALAKYSEMTGTVSDTAELDAAYSTAVAELDRGFAEAKAALEESEAALSELEMPHWYITDRFQNTGYVSFDGDVQKVEALSRVFPVFFYLVAALVSLTTMTRMVEENRGQTGIIRALGYSRGSVMRYYITYAAAASFFGSAVGVTAGFRVFPVVIGNAYRMMYSVPRTNAVFRPDYAITIVLLSVMIVEATTVFTCRSTLGESPAALMLPKVPKAGKRVLLEHIGFIWKHLRFSQKITVRNLFRYKKRLLMTVMGIAGCCALLVTGFGIRDSISDIVSLQYGEIYKYDISLSLGDGDRSELEAVLNSSADVTGWEYFSVTNGTVRNSGEQKNVRIVVPAHTERLCDFIELRERASGQKITLGGDGVILTEKLCEMLGVGVGDSVTLKNSDGSEASVTVSGITENYVTAYVYVGRELYTELFGEPESGTVYVTAPDMTDSGRDELSDLLLGSDVVSYLTDSSFVKDTFEGSVRSIDKIVLVLIISSGALAVIVLYNLISVNICERRKELATLKVLGFHDGEAAAYIYREIVLLCVIGTLVGFVLGIFLHAFVIRTVEVSDVMFGRSIKPLSYLFSAVITIAFSLLVELCMLPKLKKIDMVESMKASD